MNIKKEVGKVQKELTKYGLMTPGKGIDFPVSINVGVAENDYGKVTKHIFAYWKEIQMGIETEVCKCEELNKYFSGELFALGITQKIDRILKI